MALIASGSERELAKYVQFLKTENKILRSPIPGEIHTKADGRQRLLEFGRALRRAIEELITIVTAATFYRWCREENGGKKTPNREHEQRADEFYGVSVRFNRLLWMSRV